MTAPAAADALAGLLARALPGGAPDWHADLVGWLLEASPVADGDAEPPRTARLRQLLGALEDHAQRDALRARIAAAWNHPSAVRLIAETGIPNFPSIPREALHRLSRRLLPRVPAGADLRELLARAPLTEADADWVASLPDDLLAALAPLAPDRGTLLLAARLLATRASATGLAIDFLDVTGDEQLTESPFIGLPELVRRTEAALRGDGSLPDWAGAIGACRRALAALLERIESRGVSADVIFRLELVEGQLGRLQAVLRLLAEPSRADARRLAADLTRGAAEQRSLRGVARTASKRLSRKIVEHTGEAGEHYMVRTRAEWREHFSAGAAAGFLTSFTAIVKYAISGVALAPFIAGVAYWVNYSVSFCLMQVYHLLLASKQPAMTAAALAATLEQGGGHEEEIELIAGITRSQVVVTLANGLATMLLAVFLDLVRLRLTGTTFLSLETAHHGIEAIHPFLSLTAVFAVTTGISLWLSSLAAGWAANWSAFRRLPDGLRRDPRVARLVGVRRARALGDFVEHHFGGISGYIVLGMLLGFVPVLFSKFLGIGLEVRHITLQAASVALTYVPLQAAGELTWQAVAWSLAGIALTGLLNFSVSFALALRTAMRARDLSARARAALWRDLRAAFRADPGRFLWRP